MARDHRRLRVFQEAHQLVVAIYQETKTFLAMNGSDYALSCGVQRYPFKQAG